MPGPDYLEIAVLDPTHMRADHLEQIAALITADRAEHGLAPARPARLARHFRAGVDNAPVGGIWAMTQAILDEDGAVTGQDVAGFAVAEFPWSTDITTTSLQVMVAPGHRRTGVGSRLLETAAEHARAFGRPNLLAWVWEGSAEEAFFTHHGFRLDGRRPAISTRRLELARTAERRARLLDDVLLYSEDYRMIRCAGPASEEMVPRVLRLHQQLEEAAVARSRPWTAERLATWEEDLTNDDTRLYRVFAQHVQSGSFVGGTVVRVARTDPTYGLQGVTAVVPAHRGNRLGLELKLNMLAWLGGEEHDLRFVQTTNSADDARMIALNDRLGCRVAGTRVALTKTV